MGVYSRWRRQPLMICLFCAAERKNRSLVPPLFELHVYKPFSAHTFRTLRQLIDERKKGYTPRREGGGGKSF